jgi:heavy metal sensor kinase
VRPRLSGGYLIQVTAIMRSIRLSLTVYFLALVAAVLGTVSLVVYSSTTETLQEKERAAEQLLSTRYDKDRKEEQERLDHALWVQAQHIAREVQFRTGHEALRYWQLHSLGALSTMQAPLGPLPSLTWAAQCSWPTWEREGVRTDLNRELTRRVSARKSILNQADIPAPIEAGVTEYFQINSVWAVTYRSPSMKGRRFLFDPRVFASTKTIIDMSFDDYQLDDVKIRCVKLLVPAVRFGPFSPVPPLKGRSTPVKPQRMDMRTLPALCIQYGCEVTKRDANLAALTEQLEKDLAQVEGQTLESQAQLRNRLLLINALAFVAVLLGACWLVGLGLSPLRRVSSAVSQVSERDFQLHLDGRKLPGELTPIVEGLTQTLEQLQRAFAREKQATADISHELRTPLSALMTTIDVTLRKPRCAEEYREALEDCRASASQINQAVERLLALARLDAGVDRLRTQTIDATDVAKQCLAVVRPLAEARGLRLSLEADGQTVLDTDPDKLREILNNLLHNAIEYNRPAGTIGVALQRENGHLQVQVHDTGIGIAPSARPHLFERFYRADPSRQADGLHAGLGLAIVKGYVDLLGGTIEVDSVEGEGSTFRVCLPA